MYRNVDIPKRLQLAIILLVALLLMSVQQHTLRQLVSTSVKQHDKTESQLSFQQGSDTASSLGIVNGDTHLIFTACLAFALVLLLFPPVQGAKAKVLAFAALSRNSCCIVPKGP